MSTTSSHFPSICRIDGGPSTQPLERFLYAIIQIGLLQSDHPGNKLKPVK